ncbi:hypothetical protein [Bittarella massiliensis (ex Durand et al. 2017)]|uniref:Uncharacterized protein n=1 Tax=Bittarella massiliensis (ex Durand et al. 2017) TaxID=1720313 RepID=A0AAW5KB13_9FIRM|nr:hypothetical protein [Bittarella massiliensis (ex Durand et al. 2017)]MCQ4949117.1 hypothetical protein [Bittarella massiliensis (ex Durand et al. 2017)]
MDREKVREIAGGRGKEENWADRGEGKRQRERWIAGAERPNRQTGRENRRRKADGQNIENGG